MKKSEETEKDGKPLTSTFGASAITTDLKDSDLLAGDQEVDLSKAKITLPGTAPAPTEPAEEVEDTSFAGRARKAGIGLVRVDGIDFRYVGQAPAREGGKAKTPSGYPISSENSTFTPLSEVGFDPSIRVRVGDKYFFPQDATSWEGVKDLVPDA
jgi:hypothetical protein